MATLPFPPRYAVTPRLLTKPSRRRSGQRLEAVRFLVAHDTGNPGSTAAQNVAYFERSRDEVSASAHLFVDDHDVLECVPALTQPPEKAWHVLYGVPTDNQLFGVDANDGAVGVEYCYGGAIDADEAYRRYVWLLALLCLRFDLDPATRVVGHFFLDPRRKTDPVTGLADSRRTYEGLLRDVRAEHAVLGGRSPDPGTEFVATAGRATATVRLNLRKGRPSRLAEVAQVVEPGTALGYDGWVNDGDPVNGNPRWFRDVDGNWFWSGGAA
jgi:N-acetylmuramoyl-L-alanine amidase